jgi:hypothetical protein
MLMGAAWSLLADSEGEGFLAHVIDVIVLDE